MVGWHHRLNGHEFEQTAEDSEGFQGISVSKESACNAGNTGSIPGSGRAPGGGSGKPLQYSCLNNPMERGAWPQSMGLRRVGHDWSE